MMEQRLGPSTTVPITEWSVDVLSVVQNAKEPPMLMSSEAYIASGVTLIIIGFFGFFFNMIVIVLMLKDRQLWTPMNIILFNLVCSDMSVSIVGHPFVLLSAFARQWIFGEVMCVAYGFFMSLLGITSITTLTVLSFERYLMVSGPLNAKRHLNPKCATIMVVGIWCYSILLTTPPLFGWGNYVHESANISCSVDWESKSYTTTTYIVFLFTFGLVLPIIIIFFSYLNILRTMRSQSRTLQNSSTRRAERRVTCMIALMIVAFMIAWTPYAALALTVQFWDANFVSPAMSVIPALFAKSSICYNPIIYVGLNTQFRSSMKSMFFTESSDNALVKNAFNSRSQATVCFDMSISDEFKVQAKRHMRGEKHTPTKTDRLLELLPVAKEEARVDERAQSGANLSGSKRNNNYKVIARRLSTIDDSPNSDQCEQDDYV